MVANGAPDVRKAGRLHEPADRNVHHLLQRKIMSVFRPAKITKNTMPVLKIRNFWHNVSGLTLFVMITSRITTTTSQKI